MTNRLTMPVVTLLLCCAPAGQAQTPAPVTLTSTASPAAGEPGVTAISLTGSGFPAGTISAAAVTVTLKPTAGGASVTTPATAVTTVAGTTRRVTFTIPTTVSVSTPAAWTAAISGGTSAGALFASSNSAALTVNPAASLTSLSPNSGLPGQTVSIAITGQFSNFVQGATQAAFGAGIATNSTTVTNATHATANVTIAPAANPGARTVSMTTGLEAASLSNGFTVNPGVPSITDFNPKSAPAGTLITVSGNNLQPAPGTAAQFTLASQGGGTLTGFASSAAPSSLTFIVPAGAATGVPSFTVNAQTVNAPAALTIVPSSTFSVSAAPGTATLIQGQSAAVSVGITSATGFNSLAALSVTGVPQGVSAAFKPQSITAGQTSVLTLTAPGNQPIATSRLTIAAAATVSGLPVTQTSGVSLAVKAPTTSLLGRTVVSDSLETSLAGVTVTMLGKDGNGNITGCTGGTVSDAAGNFLLANLPATCVGPQLIGYDGSTVTSPAGRYAGVNIVYTLALSQVTASPVLVHLPRIDNVETFYVTQNSSANQSYAFTSIPGLSVTVYAGTTFTMPDGTRPNPFPLAAVQVPVDRLPDQKPNVPTMIRAFIVAFQPANATTNEPVAVYFPNTLNTAPGTDMVLMTLDPTHGQMVPYGTGSVSADGTQIVPDADPGHPGHLYGLIHFDWHGPMPPTPPPAGPGPTPCDPTASCCQSAPCPSAGGPIDLSSGIDIIRATDLAINGPLGSISIVRTMRTMSSTPGPFGIGTNFNYGYYLLTFPFVTAQGPITLVMPDGNQFPFSIQRDGTLINTATPSMRGAVITSSGGAYNIRWKNGTVYQFLANGNRAAYLSSIIDPNGNTITLTLNPLIAGQVTQVTDPVARSLNLSYDASGRVTSISDSIARTVQYTYNSSGFLATVTDPEGGIMAYTYDGQNNLLTVTDPRGVITEQNTYDANGRVVRQVEGDGGIFHFSYTLLNPLVPESPSMQTVVTDPLGRQTTYRFNPNQLLTDVIDPAGQTKTFSLDSAHSSLVSAISGVAVCSVCGDSKRGDLRVTLDDAGNILTSTNLLGNTSTYTYEPVFNKITSIRDPLANISTFTYDTRGNLIVSTDPNGNATSYAYNAFGQVTQSTDATGAKTTFQYGGFGDLVTVTDALGNFTTTAYDAVSRAIQHTDALGRRSQIAYDTLDHIVSQTNAENNITLFTYDAVGNLLSMTDARDNTTFLAYDSMKRLLTRTTPLGTSDSRTYDFNGNLLSFRDRRGQRISFEYDGLNRLVSEAYNDGTVVRSYDANSRLVQVNDSSSGWFGLTYDEAGRLISSTTPVGGLQYIYDGTNRLVARQVSGQVPVNYIYDHNGNLISAMIAGATVDRAYDARNLLLTVDRANGVSSQNAYDALGRVVSMTHAGAAGILNSQTYRYDSFGNRTSSTTQLAQSLTTQPVASATYNGNNEQIQFGLAVNSFDANGNLISISDPDGRITYSWDSRNRLASITTSGGQVTQFTYDFEGNVIQQRDSGPGLNVAQSFILDDISNVAYVNRSDADQYAILGGRALDQHYATVHGNGQVEYSLVDAVNSTIATVDGTGMLKGRFFYEPFGQTTAVDSSFPFQFTGRVSFSADAYYYRERYYDARLARFIGEDPLSVIETNLYSYGANNPVNTTDPLGLDPNGAKADCDQECDDQASEDEENCRRTTAAGTRERQLCWIRANEQHAMCKADCSRRHPNPTSNPVRFCPIFPPVRRSPIAAF